MSVVRNLRNLNLMTHLRRKGRLLTNALEKKNNKEKITPIAVYKLINCAEGTPHGTTSEG